MQTVMNQKVAVNHTKSEWKIISKVKAFFAFYNKLWEVHE